MRFLYKIHSGYDGFTPKRIPERMLSGKLLRLGWARHLDVVEQGWEVWVYFRGPHKFTDGVYVKGFVHTIDVAAQRVLLRVREFSTAIPLTDTETGSRIASVVAPRYRQVFVYPEEWNPVPVCTVGSSAESCRQRKCDTCPNWRLLPIIAGETLGRPSRLSVQFDAFAPAFWVVPARCYLVMSGQAIAPAVRKGNELFYRLKSGDETVVYPLALGIYEALRRRKLLDFEAIVPVPLSPDKASAGYLHRTLRLAQELARLLGCALLELLRLTKPISKRVLRAAGYTARQFESAYYQALAVDAEKAKHYRRLLLVDDVCTEGSTLRAALWRLREANPTCKVVAATAGQMIVKAVVQDEEPLLA